MLLTEDVDQHLRVDEDAVVLVVALNVLVLASTVPEIQN
jgi:hypothetical protein